MGKARVPIRAPGTEVSRGTCPARGAFQAPPPPRPRRPAVLAPGSPPRNPVGDRKAARRRWRTPHGPSRGRGTGIVAPGPPPGPPPPPRGPASPALRGAPAPKARGGCPASGSGRRGAGGRGGGPVWGGEGGWAGPSTPGDAHPGTARCPAPRPGPPRALRPAPGGGRPAAPGRSGAGAGAGAEGRGPGAGQDTHRWPARRPSRLGRPGGPSPGAACCCPASPPALAARARCLVWGVPAGGGGTLPSGLRAESSVRSEGAEHGKQERRNACRSRASPPAPSAGLGQRSSRPRFPPTPTKFCRATFGPKSTSWQGARLDFGGRAPVVLAVVPARPSPTPTGPEVCGAACGPADQKSFSLWQKASTLQGARLLRASTLRGGRSSFASSFQPAPPLPDPHRTEVCGPADKNSLSKIRCGRSRRP